MKSDGAQTRHLLVQVVEVPTVREAGNIFTHGRLNVARKETLRTVINELSLIPLTLIGANKHQHTEITARQT